MGRGHEFCSVLEQSEQRTTDLNLFCYEGVYIAQKDVNGCVFALFVCAMQ